MCGIAGFSLPHGLSARQREERFREPIARMTQSLWHRGPDAQRALLLDGMALGHTRLSIVDLAGGEQPMRDPATGLTVVFNGEIFNHVELRATLASGYAFRTRSDTEVLLAAFLARGIDCVEDFIGQFAFALWDPRDRSLYLARDRVGIRPLVYARTPHGIAFASEAKALFASGQVRAALDPRAIKETVHLWAPVAPRTFFEDVSTLPPASVARFRDGQLDVRTFWELRFDAPRIDEAHAVEATEAALDDAVRLRLRADVPVAAYLSGGLDSSLLCAMAQTKLGGSLETFSVRFEHDRYDEGAFQGEVARALGTAHHSVTVSDAAIGALLPTVIEHAEAITLRSAPAPFFQLSALVREHGTKVVLTGEGADEIFWGYDLFKETRVRAFWARQPASRLRPLLFRRLYPYLPLANQSPETLELFFGEGLDRPDDPLFSHRIRYSNSGRIARFFAADYARSVSGHDPGDALLASLPPSALEGAALERAQRLEMTTFLSGYLLSTQGDRMLMGNSVEGRFPFLDHRLVELAARLPARVKLRTLLEKFVLRAIGARRVPPAVLTRSKFPYRAPVAETLVGPNRPEWSRELLSASALEDVGIFDGRKVTRLLEKLGGGGAAERASAAPSEADNMALMAVVSTQLLAHNVRSGWPATGARSWRDVEVTSA